MLTLTSLALLRNIMSPPTDPVVFVVGEHEEARPWSTLVHERGVKVRSFRSPIEFRDDDNAPGCVLLAITSENDLEGIQACARWMVRGDDRPLVVVASSPAVAGLLRRLVGGRVSVFEASEPVDAVLAKVFSVAAEHVENRRLQMVWLSINERFQSLSTKDREVIDLLKLGLPNKAIAQRLVVTERAIEMRRANVMKKLRARSHAELIRLITQHEVVKRFGLPLPIE